MGPPRRKPVPRGRSRAARVTVRRRGQDTERHRPMPPGQSFAKVLSERNRELLATIAREKPDSVTDLAALAGRSKSNLSRTLKTMS